MRITVNISDAKVSHNPGDTIVTYSLGSCIGVALYDPLLPIAGLLHFQLPSSTMDTERAKRQPLMFADTGLDTLISEMVARGADKKRLIVKLAGGARMLEENSAFDIGKRNHAAIHQALEKHGLIIDAEDVGGSSPRTIYINVADGRVTLKRGDETTEI